MTERPQSYVGVSGVVNPDQQDILRGLADTFLPEGRRLALGVKAVHKTQWLDIENKYTGDWYPVGEAIRGALGRSDRAELLVAQVFLDQKDAAERGVEDYERRFMRRLMGRSATWLGGVQFDMLPWHTTDFRELFDEMKSRNDNLEILLQCQGPVMEELGPQKALRRLDDYKGLVDHVLFDASHGTGAEMNPGALTSFVDEAAEREWLGVGVAGGLDAVNVAKHLPQLLEHYPGLSFDAEGRLHVNHDGGKSLNLEVTSEYLEVSGEVLASRDDV